MNIMTFCTPVSITPKLWVLALYYDTLTKDSLFAEDNKQTGILQLLTPAHAPLVPLLGKQSRYKVDKAKACSDVGYTWKHIKMVGHELLPNCALYLHVQIQSTVDAGDHVVAICQVVNTGRWNTESDSLEWLAADDSPVPPLDAPNVLYSGWLRDQGIL